MQEYIQVYEGSKTCGDREYPFALQIVSRDPKSWAVDCWIASRYFGLRLANGLMGGKEMLIESEVEINGLKTPIILAGGRSGAGYRGGIFLNDKESTLLGVFSCNPIERERGSLLKKFIDEQGIQLPARSCLR